MLGLSKEKTSFFVFTVAVLAITAPFRTLSDLYGDPMRIAAMLIGLVATGVYILAAAMAYRREFIKSCLPLSGGIILDSLRFFLMGDALFGILLSALGIFTLLFFALAQRIEKAETGKHR